MKTIRSILLLAACTAMVHADYQLVWSDEFNIDGRPNPANWVFEHGHVRNNEAQWYQPANAFCTNGLLIIEARREKTPNTNYEPDSTDWRKKWRTAGYTSACLKTRGLHSWKYGRFEMRAKIDTRPGMWPAFWTLGDKGHWPHNGEIDIMEYYKDTLLANTFWWSGKQHHPKGDTSKTPLTKIGNTGWADQFHVWRMDWDAESIELYVDDQLLNTIETKKLTNPAGSEIEQPFHQPHYILVNLAIGGTCGGDPSRTAFPARYEIDYVRVYQQQALTSPALGVWSWSQDAFKTEAARNEMFAFSKREGISHIDQHVSIRKGKLQNPDALAALVTEATTQGITVNALRGDKAMFFETNHERTLADIQTLIAFNNTLPKHARLAGIKFDVEPYLTPEWKAGDDQRAKVILDYLDFLETAKTHLAGSELELSVDVPFWWDKPVYEIEFNGTTQRFVQHIQDLTDWIGIMSYRREAKDILKLVSAERAHAVETERPRSIAPGLETSKISGKEAFISFGGVPPETFRNTLAELRGALADDPSIRCIMLHHYGSLPAYLAQPSSRTE